MNKDRAKSAVIKKDKVSKTILKSLEEQDNAAESNSDLNNES